MSRPVLVVDEFDRHLVARIDRPEARNAINEELVSALHALCDRVERRPTVVVITGGDGMFAAGADIGELARRGRSEALRGITIRLFDRLAALPMPTIAVIDGPAIGGGAELAYACDFRIGSHRVKFANPEVGLGIIAGAGACSRLAELVGTPLAKEILLAGRVLTAAESLAAGLLTSLVDSSELWPAADDLVGRISRGAPLALQLTKTALRAPAGAHPAVDELAQAVLFETADKHDRMTAFLTRSAARK